MSRYRYQSRRAFTLVELLTVMAIIGVLAGLLLPAIAGAREAMRRAQCVSNMSQISKAVANYESVYRFLPPAGKGIDKAAFQAYVSGVSGATYENAIKVGRYASSPTLYSPSVFLTILPYLDNAPIYDQYNFSNEYNDIRVSLAPGETDVSTFNPNTGRFGNIGASTTRLPFLICPSNPVPINDPFKFGRTDYAATVYTDIFPGAQYMPGMTVPSDLKLGAKYSYTAQEGALGLKSAVSSTIVDGQANTILFIEDAGRADSVMGYNTMATADRINPLSLIEGGKFCYACAPAIGDPTNSHYTIHRWADPSASGIGISGNANADKEIPTGYINNSNSKLGGLPPLNGGIDTRWSNHNYGNNQEAYAFHRGGVNVVLADSSAHFLSETIDPVTLRFLVTKAEKKQPPQPPFSE